MFFIAGIYPKREELDLRVKKIPFSMKEKLEEGGFTEEETEYIKEQGALEISLGKRIYRAETAAIVIGGILADVYK